GETATACGAARSSQTLAGHLRAPPTGRHLDRPPLARTAPRGNAGCPLTACCAPPPSAAMYSGAGNRIVRSSGPLTGTMTVPERPYGPASEPLRNVTGPTWNRNAAHTVVSAMARAAPALANRARRPGDVPIMIASARATSGGAEYFERRRPASTSPTTHVAAQDGLRCQHSTAAAVANRNRMAVPSTVAREKWAISAGEHANSATA